MLATQTQTTAVQAPAYLSIQIESLRLDKVLDFDIYINTGRGLILYRSKQLPFSEKCRQKLADNKVSHIYIRSDARAAYQRYIEENLQDILKDPKIPEVKKATLLYDTSKSLVKEVLSNPTYSDNVRRSQDMVENTVGYILKGRQAFLNLLKITAFDYYTYSHSVNVCTFSIALARQVGITDQQALKDLGTGALLHDVGKSKIAERILNKRTPLNGAEIEIIKKHPEWGVDLLRQTNLVNQESYLPVVGHHERIDGSGYPYGTRGRDQHLYSRIVAVCDIFDALTTQRVYQKAMATFSALKLMHGLQSALDRALLKEFTILMGPDTQDNRF